MNNLLDDNLISVPLGNQAHDLALSFASQQANPVIGKKVYLNILAVWAVHTYLKWMQVETDLPDSNGDNLALSTIDKAKNLVIPDLGKIECYPLLPNENQISITFDIFEECLGLVAVQFSQDLTEVHLLGFKPTIDLEPNTEQISTADLQPLDDLFDYVWRLRTGLETLPIELRKNQDPVAARLLERLEQQGLTKVVAQLEKLIRTTDDYEWRYEGSSILQGKQDELLLATREGNDEAEEDEDVIEDIAEELTEALHELWAEDEESLISDITHNINHSTIKISDWFDNIFTQGWSKTKNLFNGNNLVFATRNQSFDAEKNIIHVAKLIDIGLELEEKSLVLLIACMPNNKSKITVTVQLYPAQSMSYLPPNIILKAIDKEGNLIQEAIISSSADNYIQLKRFSATVGVEFSLEISLGDLKLRENFIL